jgi:hypothetical protein
MTTLTQASRQWATRPDDQRFTSLTELHEHCDMWRQQSRDKVVPAQSVAAHPLEDPERKSLVVIGPGGNPIAPTNWAFGQLATLAGAPASYLRDLPADIAADCINHGLRSRRGDGAVKVLLHREAKGDAAEMTAVTGPGYGRVWNSTITRALVRRFGDGLTGDFTVPGEFGKALERVTKDNTTLYASDRDMFVFLADEKRRIEVPNTRAGATGKRMLARGFFIWNSEVGASSYGIAMFLFDYVCMNRIVWGVEGHVEIKGRHTAGAPERWLDEVQPAIRHYAEASVAPVEARLIAAQRAKVADVDSFLLRRFTKQQAHAIKLAHLKDEGRPIESVWDAANGVTALARGVGHQDRRIDLEREAGKVLDMVA